MSTQSIIESIISPKIVSSGGGYVAKTDITNVDMVQHSVTQCGQNTLSDGIYAVANSAITLNSVVLVTPVVTGVATRYYGVNLVAGTGFTIYSSSVGDTSKVNWFIAKY
jgi:hypothetical protein